MAPDSEYGVETPLVKRRLRADARRNRDRLLIVADQVFASRGPGASTEDIARAAGVGIGTLFCHFPTKEALPEAVFVARLEHLAQVGDHLASSDDAGAAFATFFRQIVGEAQTKLIVAEALASAGVDLAHAAADTKRAFTLALERLLRRAQAAGAVRADIGLGEVVALIVGASRAVQHLGSDASGQARTIQVFLDGLAVHDPPTAART